MSTVVKSNGLPEAVAVRLWRQLDVDKNGIVDAIEFSTALENLTHARAFLRYCPDCQYDNLCEYCTSLEVKQCNQCTREVFCPEHWAGHPKCTDEAMYR